MSTPGTSSKAWLLHGLPWVAVVALGVVPTLANLLTPGETWSRPVVLAVFFFSVALRSASGVLTNPSSRMLPLTMATALALFGIGSLTLALNPALGFPSAAEAWFACAYLCFTGFLILDTTGRNKWNWRTLLETAVIAGGIISGALFVLVTPLAAHSPQGDLSLLVALVYPIADLVLLTILLTQLATRHRLRDRRSGVLVSGLLLLALVDASLPLGLGSGAYAFSTVQDVVWAVALTLLADGAARPASARVAGLRPGLAAPAAVAAGLCAVVVLAADGGATPTWLTHPPAVLTLLASLGLLLSSLRDAHLATEAQRLSRTDDLTGLGNRRAVVELLAAERTGELTLMILDLNGFKTVNDAFGHPEGDRLLIEVGKRLNQVLPGADLVARLGGDEFAVVYRGHDADQVLDRARAILTAIMAPSTVAGFPLIVTLAIGIAASDTCPERLDGTELMRRADVAMYLAKAGGGGYRWYDERTDEPPAEQVHLIEELRVGISEGQLCAVFQPQVDATGEELLAVEALVRWQHPTRGLLLPNDFLPLARAAGLMLPLSLEMIRMSIAQAADWAQAGRPIRTSLNVGAPELLSGAWVPALVVEIERYGLDPALVTVELTEELLLSDPTRATDRVRELARHGIEVSIDDYGTGYSGMTWLQMLPVCELKIAREFVSQLSCDPRTRMIVESTVRLATSLGLRVVAEGVEDLATAAVVADMGVGLIQGYLVSRPLTAVALDAWRESGSNELRERVTAQSYPSAAGALTVAAGTEVYSPRHPG